MPVTGATWGLLAAFGAALCYGVGSVLQAVAARRAPAADGLDPRFLATLLRSGTYLAGVGLDALGFVASLLAVRTLPLFVVEAVTASFLAVTAVLGALLLRMPLTRADALGLVTVVVGLVLVALAAADGPPAATGRAFGFGLLVAVCLVGAAAVPAARVTGARGAAALGLLAGLAGGATAVAARVLPAVRVTAPVRELPATLRHAAGVLLAQPATYALALAGVLTLVAYSTALQRGTVTQATAPLVVGETVAPALVGVWLLGDHPRAGLGGLAVLGFVLAVVGALALARHGDLEHDDAAAVPR